MSILGEAKQKWSVRGAAARGRTRTAFRVFEVLTSTLNDGEILVKLAPGVPRKGDTHPEDPFMKVVSVDAGPSNGSGLLWEVRVEYESRPAASFSSSTNADTSDPTSSYNQELRISFIDADEPVDKDVDGKAVVNFAEEPFNPPLTDDVSTTVYTYTINRPAIDENHLKFKNTLNAQLFHGKPVGTCKIANVAFDSGADGVVETIEVHYREDGWGKRVLQQGAREKYKKSDGTTAYRYQHEKNDPNGAIITTPQYLTKDGAFYEPNSKVTPIWTTFLFKRQKDWTPLGLK